MNFYKVILDDSVSDDGLFKYYFEWGNEKEDFVYPYSYTPSFSSLKKALYTYIRDNWTDEELVQWFLQFLQDEPTAQEKIVLKYLSKLGNTSDKIKFLETRFNVRDDEFVYNMIDGDPKADKFLEDYFKKDAEEEAFDDYKFKYGLPR